MIRLLAGLLACAASGQAAVVTFSEPVVIRGDTDVDTKGALDRAYNLGASVAVVVNGVTFAGTGADAGTFGLAGVDSITLSGGGSAGFGPGAGLSREYASLLNSSVWRPRTFSLIFHDLTVGKTYRVQLWVQDARVNTERRVAVKSPEGVEVKLDVNTTNEAGGTGQFVIGTFTADASAQTLTFTGVENAPYLSAVQLRMMP